MVLAGLITLPFFFVTLFTPDSDMFRAFGKGFMVNGKAGMLIKRFKVNKLAIFRNRNGSNVNDNFNHFGLYDVRIWRVEYVDTYLLYSRMSRNS